MQCFVLQAGSQGCWLAKYELKKRLNDNLAAPLLARPCQWVISKALFARIDFL